jgi:DNA-binding IscR family transcriptional regulator
LLDLKRDRVAVRVSQAHGGYQLNWPPAKISLGEVLRWIDGPFARFEDAESLRRRVQSHRKHRPLFRVLLNIRNATAKMLDHTSLADLCCRSRN